MGCQQFAIQEHTFPSRNQAKILCTLSESVSNHIVDWPANGRATEHCARSHNVLGLYQDNARIPCGTDGTIFNARACMLNIAYPSSVNERFGKIAKAADRR